MKKMLCTLLALLLSVCTASAEELIEEEIFLSQCNWQVAQTTQGYADPYMTRPNAAVAGGTYCQMVVRLGEAVRIAYYEDGVIWRCYVEPSALISVSPPVTITDEQQGGTSSGASSFGSQSSGSSSGKTSGSSGASSGKTQPSDNTVRSPGGATGEGIGGVSVKVVTLGTRTSVVSMDGKQQELPTTELTFAPGIPDSHKVAYIYAPESGQCWMRKSPSESGTTIRKCSAGTVVAVLEVGDSFTKIRYRDDVGYVLTRCLVFCNPERGTIGTGMITLKGNGSGRADINVRNAPTREAVVVKSWKTGTLVEVFSFRDGWYEVEYKGVHAFVKEDYLTMQ